MAFPYPAADSLTPLDHFIYFDVTLIIPKKHYRAHKFARKGKISSSFCVQLPREKKWLYASPEEGHSILLG